MTLGTPPAGYSTVGNSFGVSVAQTTFTLPSTAFATAAGITLPRTGSLSITDTRSGGATVTVTVGNAALASVSTDPAVMGGSAVTLTGVTSALPTIYLQGLAQGSTTLTYTSPGFATVVKTLSVGLGSVGLSSSVGHFCQHGEPVVPADADPEQLQLVSLL